MRYTKEILENAVKVNVSMAGVLRTLGRKQAGGTQSHVTRKVKGFGIDTSHFLGKRANRGVNHKGPKYDPLILRTEFQPRTKGQVLRRALLQAGVSDVCSQCGQLPIWNNKPLVLTPDHKNGKFWDNRLENLELLCPNCHSQTQTFSGRNKLSA